MEDERFKVEGEWGKGKSERLKGFRTKCKTALIESCRIHVHVEIREIMFTLTESMTKDICRDDKGKSERLQKVFERSVKQH